MPPTHRRMKALYESYDLKITEMSIPRHLPLQLDSVTGQSPLPSSLISLALGGDPLLTPPPSTFSLLLSSAAAWWRSPAGSEDQPLTPGVLPSSLRDLHIGPQSSQKLMAGSLPAGLQCLNVHDATFPHCLPEGVVPASLLVLYLPLSPELMAKTVVPPTVRLLFCRQSCRAAVEAMKLPSTTHIAWY